MGQEPGKMNEGQQEGRAKESADYYCYQFGSDYCKKQCPNNCYQRFQEKVNKLFGNLNDSDKQ